MTCNNTGSIKIVIASRTECCVCQDSYARVNRICASGTLVQDIRSGLALTWIYAYKLSRALQHPPLDIGLECPRNQLPTRRRSYNTSNHLR